MPIPSAPSPEQPRFTQNQFSLRRHMSVEDAEDARHVQIMIYLMFSLLYYMSLVKCPHMSLMCFCFADL